MDISKILSFFKSGKNWIIMILTTAVVTLGGFYVDVKKDGNQKDERIAALTHKDFEKTKKISRLKNMKAEEKRIEKEFDEQGKKTKETIVYKYPEWVLNEIKKSTSEGITQYPDDDILKPFMAGVGWDFYQQIPYLEGGLNFYFFYATVRYPIIMDWKKCTLDRLQVTAGVFLPLR